MSNRFLMYVFVVLTAGLVSRWAIPPSASVLARMGLASAIAAAVYAVTWGVSHAPWRWWAFYGWTWLRQRDGYTRFNHGTLAVAMFTARDAICMQVVKPYKDNRLIQSVRLYRYTRRGRMLQWAIVPTNAAQMHKRQQRREANRGV